MEPSSHTRGTLAAIHQLAVEISSEVKPDLEPVARAADVARAERGLRTFVDAQVQGLDVRVMDGT